jgi:hypothetical protein
LQGAVGLQPTWFSQEHEPFTHRVLTQLIPKDSAGAKSPCLVSLYGDVSQDDGCVAISGDSPTSPPEGGEEDRVKAADNVKRRFTGKGEDEVLFNRH